jgi:hypothetical protein
MAEPPTGQTPLRLKKGMHNRLCTRISTEALVTSTSRAQARVGELFCCAAKITCTASSGSLYTLPVRLPHRFVLRSFDGESRVVQVAGG